MTVHTTVLTFYPEMFPGPLIPFREPIARLENEQIVLDPEFLA